MIVVSDAVAEIDRTTHEAGLTIMNRIFADVKITESGADVPQHQILRVLGRWPEAIQSSSRSALRRYIGTSGGENLKVDYPVRGRLSTQPVWKPSHCTRLKNI